MPSPVLETLRYCDYYGQMSYADFLEYEKSGATGKYEISISDA